MINFTVGPVQSSDTVRAIASEQIPYFRTEEFSKLMIENEKIIKDLAKAKADSRAVFLTCSGSGGMEAAIMNTLTSQDKALVVNGGSFGERFVDLLTLHKIPFTEIKLEYGKALKPEDLTPYKNQGYTAFLLQHHETSTGVLYDIEMVGQFCKENHIFLILDTISSFLCDSFRMKETGVDLVIVGSQKGLSCDPGIATLILSNQALQRVENVDCCCRYLDVKIALKNQERGQTPWTPAVGVLRQINVRVKEIEMQGGVEAEVKRCSSLANYFRNKIKEHQLPFEIVSESLSNAVTPLHPTTQSAHEIFLKIKDEYHMWICPNGGDLKDKVFRVGHIGYLQQTDYDKLIEAFLDLREKKFI